MTPSSRAPPPSTFPSRRSPPPVSSLPYPPRPFPALSLIPRYDAFFLRTASFDIPSEGKSAFAQEMDDVAILASECGPRSLIMLDELGRGTSAREGSALGVSILEWLAKNSMGAIFATHLHEMEAVLAGCDTNRLQSLRRVTMDVSVDASTGHVRMGYTLRDGSCNDSLALHAAAAAGVPMEIVARAGEILRRGAAAGGGGGGGGDDTGRDGGKGGGGGWGSGGGGEAEAVGQRGLAGGAGSLTEGAHAFGGGDDDGSGGGGSGDGDSIDRGTNGRGGSGQGGGAGGGCSDGAVALARAVLGGREPALMLLPGQVPPPAALAASYVYLLVSNTAAGGAGRW